MKEKNVSEIHSTLIAGYRKKDVENHIEKLKGMIEELKTVNSSLEAENQECRDIVKKAEISYTALWKENEGQKKTILEQNEQLQKYEEMIEKYKEAIEQYDIAIKQCGETIREMKIRETSFLKKQKKAEKLKKKK